VTTPTAHDRRARLPSFAVAYAALALTVAACQSPPPSPSPIAAPSTAPTAPSTTPIARPVIDWGALRLAEQECETCHPDEVAAWRASPMGRSLALYDDGSTAQRPEPGQSRVQHPLTGHQFLMAFAPGGRPTFTMAIGESHFSRPAVAAVGSGTHTRSYLWTQGDAWFEAPLTWYARRNLVALSPGYDTPDHPGMHREVGPDCLFCHADPAPHIPGTANRFAAPSPAPIGCSRCHGDPRGHLASRSGRGGARDSGVDSPAIIVPTRLPAAEKAAVCDQCHLQGAVRLARDGHAFGEYLPGGSPLEASIVTFVEATAGDQVGIASHGERLRHSKCGNGRLECTGCHAPHGERASDRSAACRDCHGKTHRACGGDGGPDCARCHMPQTETSDIPHVAMTDHFIRVVEKGQAAVLTAPPRSGAASLVRVGPRPADMTDAEASLLLARAEAERARQTRTGQAPFATRAAERLEAALGHYPDSAQGHADLASMRQLTGDSTGARMALEAAFRLSPDDARIAQATAAARLAVGDARAALQAAQRGRQSEPHDVALLVLSAQAHLSLGQGNEALKATQEAHTLSPLDPRVAQVEGLALELAGDTSGAASAYARATELAPLDVATWLTRARAAADQEAWPALLKALDGAEHALSGRGIAPGALRARLDALRALALAHSGRGQDAAPLALRIVQSGAREPAAALALAHLALETGRVDAALQFLDQAIAWTPESAAAWHALSRALRAQGDVVNAARAAAQANALRPILRSQP